MNEQLLGIRVKKWNLYLLSLDKEKIITFMLDYTKSILIS